MILLLNDTLRFAGTERHLVDLEQGLRHRGVDVAAFCPAGSAVADRVRRQGGTVIPARPGPAGFVPSVLRLANLLRRGRAEVLHAHNGRCALAAVTAKRLAGRGRVVVTQHFITPARTARRGLRKRASGAAHRWVADGVDHVVAISDAVREAAVARGDVDPDRVTRVHNGIADVRAARPADEVRAAVGVPADALLVVTAARLEAEKRVDVVIDAAAEAVRRGTDARVIVAGEGQLRAELASRIARAGVAGRVRLLGFVTDVADLIAAADVFVLPSVAEPFGLVLLEAMALARPVVAAAAGGPLEIVEDNVTGLLVPPLDVEHLASALVAMAGDPHRRGRMGRAGRARYEALFTADRMAALTAGVYEACRSSGPATTADAAGTARQAVAPS